MKRGQSGAVSEKSMSFEVVLHVVDGKLELHRQIIGGGWEDRRALVDPLTGIKST